MSATVTKPRWVRLHIADYVHGTNCQLCGCRIRWVHVLIDSQASDPSEQLLVGNGCARRLIDGTGDQKKRLAKFLNSRKWRTCPGDVNSEVRTMLLIDGTRVTTTIISSQEEGYGVTVAIGDELHHLPDSYESAHAAKVGAFQFIEDYRDGG